MLFSSSVPAPSLRYHHPCHQFDNIGKGNSFRINGFTLAGCTLLFLGPLSPFLSLSTPDSYDLCIMSTLTTHSTHFLNKSPFRCPFLVNPLFSFITKKKNTFSVHYNCIPDDKYLTRLSHLALTASKINASL